MCDSLIFEYSIEKILILLYNLKEKYLFLFFNLSYFNGHFTIFIIILEKSVCLFDINNNKYSKS